MEWLGITLIEKNWWNGTYVLPHLDKISKVVCSDAYFQNVYVYDRVLVYVPTFISIYDRLSLAPSVGGTGSNGRINEAGRQSAIGTKQKVMQDKAYQKEVERELVEFCHQHNYPNPSLSATSFPLSSTEFKQMFVFLIRFQIPDFGDLATGFESTVSCY